MLRREYPELRLIASGGVTTAQDIQALADAGVREVIVGKALYAGTVDPEEVRAFVW
jgi:phosphoribosylformimino-5-aminoimidazole carboxamide ribotide isomerase